MKQRVLIICTGNIARSQMAEGLWRHYGGDEWEVFSAATRPHNPPKPVHPMAIRVMAERSIDITAQRPKSVEQFISEKFDVVVTVCATAERDCPAFANRGRGTARHEHWPLDDPAIAGTDPDRVLSTFRRIRDEAAEHIQAFLRNASGSHAGSK